MLTIWRAVGSGEFVVQSCHTLRNCQIPKAIFAPIIWVSVLVAGTLTFEPGRQANQELQTQVVHLPAQQNMNSSPMASLAHAGVNQPQQQASQALQSHQVVNLQLQRTPEQNMNLKPMASLAHAGDNQKCLTQQQTSQQLQSHQMVHLPLQRRPEQNMNSSPTASLPQAGVGSVTSNQSSVHSADERAREYLRKHSWPEYMVPSSSVENFKLTEGLNGEGELIEIDLYRTYTRNIAAYVVTYAKKMRVRKLGNGMFVDEGITAGLQRFLNGVQLPVTMVKQRKEQLIFVVKPPLLPTIAVALPRLLFEQDANDHPLK